MAYSDRASAITLGGNEPPSETVRRMDGVEAEIEEEGRSTRIAESVTEFERVEREAMADSETREARASFDEEEDFFSPALLLLSLSAAE